jgi:hypothetical protein
VHHPPILTPIRDEQIGLRRALKNPRARLSLFLPARSVESCQGHLGIDQAVDGERRQR